MNDLEDVGPVTLSFSAKTMKLDETQQRVTDKQQQLDILLSRLDDEQEKAENLEKEHGRMETAILHCQDRISSLKAMNRARQIVLTPNNSTGFNMSKLNHEHQAYVLSLQDEIALLEQEYEHLSQNGNDANDEYDAMKDENDVLKTELQRAKFDLQKTVASYRRSKDEQEMLRSELKEQDLDFRSQNRQLRDVVAAISAVQNRHENLEAATGGDLEITHQIENIEELIGAEEIEYEGSKQELDVIEERKNTEIENIMAQIEQMEESINWKEEEQRTIMAIEDAQRELNSILENNENSDSNYQQNLVRYRKLLPIVKKWNGKTIPQLPEQYSIENGQNSTINSFSTSKTAKNPLNFQTNVDKMLLKRDQLLVNAEKHQAMTKTSIEDLIVANSKLQIQINKMKDDIAHSIAKLQFEKQQLQAAIDKKRSIAFDEEHSIVDQITALKIKVAQGKLSK